MRALALAGVTLLLAIPIPPAQAVGLCQDDMGNAWEWQECMVRQSQPSYNPPPPPSPTSPEFLTYPPTLLWYTVYFLLCTTVGPPPHVELGPDCGPQALVAGLEDPPLP